MEIKINSHGLYAQFEVSEEGKLNLLYLGAFIAVNLAVMNMLPIPALDGGRVVALLLTTAIEAITKKKINPKYEGYIHAVGMVLLLGLMVADAVGVGMGRAPLY